MKWHKVFNEVLKNQIMNNFFRALIAGYGAKKLGGGCFGTIIVFILIWVALGQCSGVSRTKPSAEAYPTNRQASISVQSFDTDEAITILKKEFAVFRA